jgi:prevent-host-death family protein
MIIIITNTREINMLEIDKIMPITQVKKNLLDIIKQISDEDATITVTKNGKPVSVMMTPHRYEALMETIEILADSEIMTALADSAKDFKAGRVYKDSEIWS